MATITENYSTKALMKAAKLRTGQRHKNGWRPIHTNKVSNGYDVVWSNDPDPPAPPKRRLTQRQLMDEIASERNAELI